MYNINVGKSTNGKKVVVALSRILLQSDFLPEKYFFGVKMKIAIIGLGLIGGSIARRLRGFHDCTIAAYNRSRESLDLAIADGVIDEAYNTPGEAMDNADLIIMCLFSFLIVNFSFASTMKVTYTFLGVLGFIQILLIILANFRKN